MPAHSGGATAFARRALRQNQQDRNPQGYPKIHTSGSWVIAQNFVSLVLNKDLDAVRIDAPSTAIDVYIDGAHATGTNSGNTISIYGRIGDQEYLVPTANLTRVVNGVVATGNPLWATGNPSTAANNFLFQTSGVAVTGWRVVFRSAILGSLVTGVYVAAVAHGLEDNS